MKERQSETTINELSLCQVSVSFPAFRVPINLFTDSLLQYYALGEVIVNIQDKSYVR